MIDDVCCLCRSNSRMKNDEFMKISNMDLTPKIMEILSSTVPCGCNRRVTSSRSIPKSIIPMSPDRESVMTHIGL